MGNTTMQPANCSEEKILSMTERKVLCSYWLELKNKEPDLFKNAWIDAMEKSYGIQKSLGLNAEVSKENQYFGQRMARVREFFDRLIIINQLEDDSVQRACWELGLKHNILLENSDFHIAYWTLIMECLIKVEEGINMEVNASEKRKFDSAWKKLVEIVFESIRQGYIDGYITRDHPIRH